MNRVKVEKSPAFQNTKPFCIECLHSLTSDKNLLLEVWCSYSTFRSLNLLNVYHIE